MAPNPQVTPEMQAEQAFRAAARACIDRYRRHLPELRQSWDAEALHQARLGLRQLLAAFDLFRPMIEGAPFRLLRERVRTAAHSLGKARDLDIVLEATHQPDLPALRSTISVQRSRIYAGVVQRLESAGNRHLAEELLDWVESGAWRARRGGLRRQPIKDIARERLDQSWKTFRRKTRHLEDLSPKPRHKVRIAAKKLYFALEFLAPLAKGRKARKRRDALITSLKPLQDVLGTLNDVRTERALAREFVRESREVAFATGKLIGAEEMKTAPLLHQAAKAARKLRKRKPFWL